MYDHYFAFQGKHLTLWKSATITKYGVNVFKEGSLIAGSAPSERERAVNHLNQDFNQTSFRFPIQRVQYIELPQNNVLQPFLIVVTSENIQLMKFKKLEAQGNRIDMSMAANHASQKNRAPLSRDYDFTQIEESGFENLTIEQNEQISKIVQMKKSGAVYYASHTEDFNKTYVKQLIFSESSESFKKVTQILPSSVLNISKTLIGGSNKRLMSRNVQDSNKVLLGLRELVPQFIDVFSERKCITDMQLDESRNLLYVLTNKMVKRTVKNGRLSSVYQDSEDTVEQLSENNNEQDQEVQVEILGEQAIDVYDIGLFANEFKKVARIT